MSKKLRRVKKVKTVSKSSKTVPLFNFSVVVGQSSQKTLQGHYLTQLDMYFRKLLKMYRLHDGSGKMKGSKGIEVYPLEFCRQHLTSSAVNKLTRKGFMMLRYDEWEPLVKEVYDPVSDGERKVPRIARDMIKVARFGTTVWLTVLYLTVMLKNDGFGGRVQILDAVDHMFFNNCLLRFFDRIGVRVDVVIASKDTCPASSPNVPWDLGLAGLTLTGRESQCNKDAFQLFEKNDQHWRVQSLRRRLYKNPKTGKSYVRAKAKGSTRSYYTILINADAINAYFYTSPDGVVYYDGFKMVTKYTRVELVVLVTLHELSHVLAGVLGLEDGHTKEWLNLYQNMTGFPFATASPYGHTY